MYLVKPWRLRSSIPKFYLWDTKSTNTFWKNTVRRGVDDRNYSSKDLFHAIASDPDSMSPALQVL